MKMEKHIAEFQRSPKIVQKQALDALECEVVQDAFIYVTWSLHQSLHRTLCAYYRKTESIAPPAFGTCNMDYVVLGFPKNLLVKSNIWYTADIYKKKGKYRVYRGTIREAWEITMFESDDVVVG